MFRSLRERQPLGGTGRSMTTKDSPDTVEDRTELPFGGRLGRVGPDSPVVVWLARLGAVFLVLELYIFGRWVTSDSFQRVMPGTDDGTNMVWIYFWDGLSIVGSIVFVTWIVRKRIRDGELPPVAIVAMAWMLTAWQDPLSTLFVRSTPTTRTSPTSAPGPSSSRVGSTTAA
ncbi:hypothetical protein [Gordonia amicalis]|uniref:hypothetical protein n=1 Tax=Gordonia amicalis TaxID=89053 RepID=UPI001FB7B242|nr:hypothetical protein [Gordonia amicalis]MDV7172451.1 hypothetical protein [Gordonia amicalis]UOG20086.1 hypothetical protein MTX80_12590 [Gordonia amicalis]